MALKIEVKEDEGSKPLNVMYTNWGNTTFSSAGYTAAIYKEKRFPFLALPLFFIIFLRFSLIILAHKLEMKLKSNCLVC